MGECEDLMYEECLLIDDCYINDNKDVILTIFIVTVTGRTGVVIRITGQAHGFAYH